MDQRCLFYWSKVYSKSLNEGQDYRELPNVIAINIVDFDYPPGGDTHTCFHLREDSDPSLILTLTLEIHYINMVKWRKQREKDLAVPLHRWLTWFDEKSPPELIEEVLSMDSAIKAAYESFGCATQQEFEEWDLERRREKARFDMGSRLSGARREGREEQAIEIARNALTKGLSTEMIHDITGLDIETINRLN
jgi:predicted transposase/invertase (TIGR01784 family)